MSKNEFTFEPIIGILIILFVNMDFFLEMYSDLRDIQKVFKLYDHMTQENIKSTYKTLNNYLEMAMRVEDVKRIVDVLQQFKKRSNKIYVINNVNLI